MLLAPEIDLAVLAVEDEAFFKGRPALGRSPGLPALQSAVEVFGYPLGGDSLSITRGIVSRIEYAELSDSAKGLRIQVDAAINPGNSGGPAVVNERMIGLVFSRLTAEAQAIGYLIPNEEIEMFLRQLPGGVYASKAMMGVVVQDLENPALRAKLKIPAKVHGAQVAKVRAPTADFPLHPDDVLTAINGVPLDDTGMLKFDGGLRLFFAASVQRFGASGKVPVTVYREESLLNLEVPLRGPVPALIPRLNGAMPDYFVYGPFVFTVATRDFWYDTERAMVPWFFADSGSPLVTRRSEDQAFEGEQLVCLAGPLLQHPIVRSLSGVGGAVIGAVNGVRIKNLRHLVEVPRDSQDEFITITYVGTSAAMHDVVRRTEVEQATVQVLTENSIRQQASPELLKVWMARRR